MRCPTLKDLPPPEGKTGWPWTEESPQLPDKTPDGRPWPKISIVTPNYNYGQFIEETIRSVLLQGYPNLEYIIIDGGSTDNSVEIIKKYEKRLTYWVSEPDRGQAHAINKGLEMATGEWFNWINSDDLLMSHALKTLTKISHMAKDAQWISGARLEMDKEGSFAEICVPWRTDPTVIGLGAIDFPQDASFVRMEFIKDNGIKLNEEYNYRFDTIFYFQLVHLAKPILTSAIFSAMRWHKAQKIHNIERRHKESLAGILPYIKQLPFTHRLFLRLLRTRLSRSLEAILLLAVICGLIPYGRDWVAVVFDRQKCAFKVIPARHAMLGL